MIIDLRQFLEQQYYEFNSEFSADDHPDPLMVVRGYRNRDCVDEIALICALYSYGNAKVIVKTLRSMPFFILEHPKFEQVNRIPMYKDDDNELVTRALNTDEVTGILNTLDKLDTSLFPFYRFQSRMDTRDLFKIVIISRVFGGIKQIFLHGLKENAISGINYLQSVLNRIAKHHNMNSSGLAFLIGSQSTTSSPLKRYNMFLRWMVRKDNIDLGIWDMSASKLVLPLDTHTFNTCKRLGLLERKSYDLKSALIITDRLKQFDCDDPVKYDFALYRIGQLKLLG